MKLLIPFTVSYYTFRCNIFVVKKHLRDSEIFSLNPTKRMGLAIIIVLVNGVNASIIVIIVNNFDVSVYFSLGLDHQSVPGWTRGEEEVYQKWRPEENGGWEVKTCQKCAGILYGWLLIS